ncbi:IS200/IS605 family element transposase accessory protein TnpB [Candidatus Woesearchaeota archaeon]|nr:IS200/IS605 family element transposase accessory protein TnpB [Candidatus Woesearchaeota archaeon]
MRSIATAKIKIKAIPEIIQTSKIYAKTLQFCIDVAWQNKIKNNINLHPFVYRYIKGMGLQSQLAIACIKQACGMIRKAKTKPMIKRASIRYNIPRSASFKNNILSLATIKGRVKIPFSIPQCYSEYFTWDIKESLLRIDKNGRCFFFFTFSKEVDIIKDNINNRVLGIDFGINNLAVTSDAKFFKSSKVKQIKRKFKFLRAKLQAKGTISAKRLLKKISGREKRFMAWVNHNISKQIVSNFEGNKIIMENLKGIRRRQLGKRMNYWISNWSFHQLQNFIKYKAERKGIEIHRVKPAFTSKICHRCGSLGSRYRGRFSCLHCGFSSYSADLNSARNLAHPMLVERQAQVTEPYSRSVDTKAISMVEADLTAKSPPF